MRLPLKVLIQTKLIKYNLIQEFFVNQGLCLVVGFEKKTTSLKAYEAAVFLENYYFFSMRVHSTL